MMDLALKGVSEFADTLTRLMIGKGFHAVARTLHWLLLLQ